MSPMTATREPATLPATADALVTFIAKEIEPALAKALDAARVASDAYEKQPAVRDGFTGKSVAEDAVASIHYFVNGAIDQVQRVRRAIKTTA